jgi:hypothetical protein
MSIINFIGQILLGAPFVVFAYWYEREEALFQSKQTYPCTVFSGLLFIRDRRLAASLLPSAPMRLDASNLQPDLIPAQPFRPRVPPANQPLF